MYLKTSKNIIPLPPVDFAAEKGESTDNVKLSWILPEFVSIKDNDQFWSKISVYFTENAHDELGKLVESEFKEVDLSNENICKIIDMCKPYQSILTPTYYSKNCPTTGLFVFLVKETLEYIGAINEKKTQPGRLYRNLEYRLNSLKEKKEKINAFIEKVKK